MSKYTPRATPALHQPRRKFLIGLEPWHTQRLYPRYFVLDLLFGRLQFGNGPFVGSRRGEDSITCNYMWSFGA